VWSTPCGLDMSFVLDPMAVVPRDDEAGSGFRHGGPPHASRVVGHLWPLSTTPGHSSGDVPVWPSLLGLRL
jgi:hypothetical protein